MEHIFQPLLLGFMLQTITTEKAFILSYYRQLLIANASFGILTLDGPGQMHDANLW